MTDSKPKSWRSRGLITLVTLALGIALAGGPSPAPAVETITYYHLDALGSPVAATDEQGNLKWREDYKPYGEKIRNEAAAATSARAYTGHVHDNDTGLTYMGARFYDPVVGRFMAVDPVAFTETNPHSFNPYGYANSNPYKFVDPDGKEAIAIGGSVRIPSWVGEIIFGDNFIGQGGSAGIAVSFPGLYGGEWDLGVYAEGHAGGQDYGIGRYSVDLTLNRDSVRDLGGKGAQHSGHYGLGGLSVSTNEKNEVSGIGIHVGKGYNIGGSGTLGRTFTVRDFVDSFKRASSDFRGQTREATSCNDSRMCGVQP